MIKSLYVEIFLLVFITLSSSFSGETSSKILKKYYPIFENSNNMTIISNMFSSINNIEKYENFYWLLVSDNDLYVNGEHNNSIKIFEFKMKFIDKGEIFYDKYPTEVISIINGLFADGAVSETRDSLLNYLYWKDEYKYIKALTETNKINKYYIKENSRLKELIYKIPIQNGKLVRTSNPIYNNKSNREKDLLKLKNKFEKKDQWIFKYLELTDEL